MAWQRLNEGWTKALDFILKDLDSGVPVNLAGATVTLVLKRQDGILIHTEGNVSIIDAAAGHIRYTPDPSDFVAKHAPYLAHFKIVVGTEVLFVPNGPEDQVQVYAG